MHYDVYPADIRGFGKCVAHTRVSDRPVFSVSREVDLLVSLHDPFALEQLPSLQPGGVVVFDSHPPREVGEDECVAGHLGPGMFLYGIPLDQLSQQATLSAQSKNIAAVGVVAGLLGIESEVFLESLGKKFRGKKAVVKSCLLT